MLKEKKYCIEYENVEEAYKRIGSIVHKTPIMTCSSLSEMSGCQNLFFKVEAMQRTGSFKFRGALNATLQKLEGNNKSNDDGGTPKSSMRVVTHSSGNHAAAVALAAKLATSTSTTDVTATIVMPKNAPIIKKTAVEGLGGHIVWAENTNESREEMADEILASDETATFVHPSEDPLVIAGQGTASYEMIHQIRSTYENQELDVVIIPVGGGGLASGNTIALRGMLGKNVKIVLAEPAEMDDAHRSFYSQTLVGHDPTNELKSVADGLKTTLGPNTWPIVRDLVDDIYTVTERQILQATQLIWQRLKVCIEPSAGVGVAVALYHSEFKSKYSSLKSNVGIILCGGNVDIYHISQLMSQHGL